MLGFASSLRAVPRLAEQFDGPPEDNNPWLKWIAGVGLPLTLAAVGLFALVTRGSIGAAVILISLSLFAHFHYFWSLDDRLAPFSELGKAIAAVPVVGTIFYGIYYFAVYM